jgi:hypothetical protein
VVLAFRSAVHLNEYNGKNYKYAVTTSDGKYASCIVMRQG